MNRPFIFAGIRHRSGNGPRFPAPVKTAGNHINFNELNGMAGATGLEPAASGVTGRRSNQLSYAPEGRVVGIKTATPLVKAVSCAGDAKKP